LLLVTATAREGRVKVAATFGAGTSNDMTEREQRYWSRRHGRKAVG
jgi:hypothetical protein